MEEIVKNKVKSLLQRFTAAYAFVFNVEYNSVNGFSHGPEKWRAVYLARETLGFRDSVICDYYKAPSGQLMDKVNGLKIALEIDDELMIKFEQLKRIWVLITDPDLKIEI